MNQKDKAAKRVFVLTSVVCGVLFGIPLLVQIIKIATGLVGEHRILYLQSYSWSEWGRFAFLDSEFWRDSLLAIIFGALAFIPPLLAFLYFDKRSRSSSDSPEISASNAAPALDEPHLLSGAANTRPENGEIEAATEDKPDRRGIITIGLLVLLNLVILGAIFIVRR